ncbi:MAG: hypothetical protein GX129_00145, partial [Clostridiales bacterium]|nr:hypothetical protein [Clostridiales bacterium]
MSEKKKKGFFRRVIGLTVAALVFGIIAGASASGYHYLFGNKNNSNDIVVIDEEKRNLEDGSVIELSDENSITATNTKIEGIITDVSDV